MSNTKDTNPKDALASNRAPLDLLPPVVKVEASLALAEGEFKYGGGNWTTAGVRARVYIAALGRHLERYSAGMDRDHNGVHELARVIAGCSVVLDAEHRGMLTDDRIYKMPDGDFEKVLDQASATMQKLRAEFARPHEDLVREDQALMNIAPPEFDSGFVGYNKLGNVVLSVHKTLHGLELSPRVAPALEPDDGPEYTVKDLMEVVPPPKGARFRITSSDDPSGWPQVGSEVTFLSVTKFGIRVQTEVGSMVGLEDQAWRFVRLPPEQLSFNF
jgi:hypothetical protein